MNHSLKTVAVLTLAILASGCAAPRGGVSRESGAGTALSRGMSYLNQAVADDRYSLACSASDDSPCPVHDTGQVFAGFFIADALGDRLTTAGKERISARLDREQRQGVWGYMPYAPVDADDTAFVLRTYRLLGRNLAPDPLLRFYSARAKGFTTFDPEGTVAVTLTPSVANNGGIHPEVNANVFTLLAGTHLAGLISGELLASMQTTRGDWPSYFYPGPYYATYMNLSALCGAGILEKARSRGTAFLLADQNPDGSWGTPGGVYETSLALNTLAVCGNVDDAFRRGTAWLLARQAPDGSWGAPETIIWEFRFSDDPPVVWRAFDRHGVVTTALAVKALKALPEQAR